MSIEDAIKSLGERAKKQQAKCPADAVINIPTSDGDAVFSIKWSWPICGDYRMHAWCENPPGAAFLMYHILDIVIHRDGLQWRGYKEGFQIEPSARAKLSEDILPSLHRLYSDGVAYINGKEQE